MGKVVDSVELLRMIRDGKLKEETKLRDVIDGEIYVVTGTIDGIIREDENGTFLNDYEVMDTLIRAKFEILSEEDREIDIDSIEELKCELMYEQAIKEKPHYSGAKIVYNTENIGYVVNQLIKAVKQLNKQLNKTKGR